MGAGGRGGRRREEGPAGPIEGRDEGGDEPAGATAKKTATATPAGAARAVEVKAGTGESGRDEHDRGEASRAAVVAGLSTEHQRHGATRRPRSTRWLATDDQAAQAGSLHHELAGVRARLVALDEARRLVTELEAQTAREAAKVARRLKAPLEVVAGAIGLAPDALQAQADDLDVVTAKARARREQALSAAPPPSRPPSSNAAGEAGLSSPR